MILQKSNWNTDTCLQTNHLSKAAVSWIKSCLTRSRMPLIHISSFLSKNSIITLFRSWLKPRMSSFSKLHRNLSHNLKYTWGASPGLGILTGCLTMKAKIFRRKTSKHTQAEKSSSSAMKCSWSVETTSSGTHRDQCFRCSAVQSSMETTLSRMTPSLQSSMTLTQNTTSKCW